ncbi:uncharacterized protein LOC121368747 [Gigantopelta aegis]|uniref:uncharacterized protein LOC121368747 n=1 Tax=Gigantopelta aegis TaxID=1735272 RepID=UPI001B888DB6|nr:uncharacterized protein LOC121368747 [Gigantopelta aegis]
MVHTVVTILLASICIFMLTPLLISHCNIALAKFRESGILSQLQLKCQKFKKNRVDPEFGDIETGLFTNINVKMNVKKCVMYNGGCDVKANKAGCDVKANKPGCDVKTNKAGYNAKANKAGCNAKCDKAGCNAKCDKAGCNAKADKAGCIAKANKAGCNAKANKAGCNANCDKAGCNAKADKAGGDAKANKSVGSKIRNFFNFVNKERIRRGQVKKNGDNRNTKSVDGTKDSLKGKNYENELSGKKHPAKHAISMQ